MTEAGKAMIAVCGLDCGACDIRRLPVDPQAAERVVSWFREMGWLQPGEGVAEAIEQRLVCQGCRGDRTVHWSADCWILHCCVDDKGLEFCHECPAFPCERLGQWAQGNKRYAQALHRLQQMRRAG
jgi:hypothetical protein